MTDKVSLHYDKKRQRWLVRWFGEYNPDTDTQHRYGKSFKRKRDAEMFQARKMTEIGDGGLRDRPPATTLGAFCKDWLAAHRGDVRHQTLVHYENTICRLKQYFGKGRPLASITPKEAKMFLTTQKPMRVGRKKDRQLTDWTRERIRRNCGRLFRTAVDWRLLTHNPFSHIRGKKLVPGRWHVIKPEEYLALLEVVSGNARLQAFYATAYTGGLRLGELTSLVWEDIDFQAGRVTIASRAATETLPPFQVKDHESRTVPLPQHTIDLLTKWQTEAPEHVPYVFITAKRYQRVLEWWQSCRESGTPWRGRNMLPNVLRNFRAHMKRAGVKGTEKLTFHMLRKSCGKNWAKHVEMYVTKDLMGHASIETTAAFYLQTEEEDEAKAAGGVDAQIKKASETEVRQD